MSKKSSDPYRDYVNAFGQTVKWIWIGIAAMMTGGLAIIAAGIFRPLIVVLPLSFLAALVAFAQMVRYLMRSLHSRRVALDAGQIRYSKIRFTDDHPVLSALIVATPIAIVAVLLALSSHHR